MYTCMNFRWINSSARKKSMKNKIISKNKMKQGTLKLKLTNVYVWLTRQNFKLPHQLQTTKAHMEKPRA